MSGAACLPVEGNVRRHTRDGQLVYLLYPSLWLPELCVSAMISIEMYMYSAYLHLLYPSVVLLPIMMSCGVRSLETAYTCPVRGRGQSRWVRIHGGRSAPEPPRTALCLCRRRLPLKKLGGRQAGHMGAHLDGRRPWGGAREPIPSLPWTPHFHGHPQRAQARSTASSASLTLSRALALRSTPLDLPTPGSGVRGSVGRHSACGRLSPAHLLRSAQPRSVLYCPSSSLQCAHAVI